MNWQEALTQRLLDDTGVAAIVGTRVRWDRAEQDDAPPFLVLTEINDARPRHADGFVGYRPTLVQVDAYHTGTKTAAITLREAVIAALAEGGVFDGRRFDPARVEAIRPGEEDVTGGKTAWRESIDLTLWHD